jgi:ribosomal protein S18 acetylase RimI-like enzyme
VTAVTTRLATPEDVPAIAAVHAEGWEAFRGVLPEAVWRPRTEERRRGEWPAALRTREVILAEQDGAAVGFISAWREGDEGHLSTFFVASAARGRGLGSRLLREGAERLAEQGAAAILIQTFADGPARALFDRLGGEVVERGMRDYGGAEVAEVTYRWPARALAQAIANT